MKSLQLEDFERRLDLAIVAVFNRIKDISHEAGMANYKHGYIPGSIMGSDASNILWERIHSMQHTDLVCLMRIYIENANRNYVDKEEEFMSALEWLKSKLKTLNSRGQSLTPFQIRSIYVTAMSRFFKAQNSKGKRLNLAVIIVTTIYANQN